jgi:hypothetical protein
MYHSVLTDQRSSFAQSLAACSSFSHVKMYKNKREESTSEESERLPRSRHFPHPHWASPASPVRSCPLRANHCCNSSVTHPFHVTNLSLHFHFIVLLDRCRTPQHARCIKKCPTKLFVVGPERADRRKPLAEGCHACQPLHRSFLLDRRFAFSGLLEAAAPTFNSSQCSC